MGFRENISSFFQVPAPRLSRSPAIANVKVPEPEMGENTIEILDELGYSKNDISDLMQKGAISCAKANL